MKVEFNKTYFLAFLTLLLTEVAIAYYLKSGFIRHTVGDFLVVILIYCFLQAFSKTKSKVIAVVTLGIAYIVEFLQRTTFLELLGVQNEQWANLIFGNSFSIQDLIAYTLGMFLVLLVEKMSRKHLISRLQS